MMKWILILLINCLVVNGATPGDINLSHSYPDSRSVEIQFSNDFDEAVRVCWENPVSDSPKQCTDVPVNTAIKVTTYIDHSWGIYSFKSEGLPAIVKMTVVGGLHLYRVRSLISNSKLYSRSDDELKEKSIIRVKTPPKCVDYGGFDCRGTSLTDAIRRAAFRLAPTAGLCLCGEYNSSTTFTYKEPNFEAPLVLSGDRCNCDSNEFDMDMYVPCNWDNYESRLLIQNINCPSLMKHKHQDDLRLFLLHTTNAVDRLTMKHKIWVSLLEVYGLAAASLIMPMTYNFVQSPSEVEKFKDICRELVKTGADANKIFILKNVVMHRQHGISLVSPRQFIEETDAGTLDTTYTTISEFMSDPYTINGYKLNMRRYVLLVCTGGRLRAYVHDDGKNIYTLLPYREPYEGESWSNDTELSTRRLQETITTGYVPEEHYDDKPLSGLEFAQYLKTAPPPPPPRRECGVEEEGNCSEERDAKARASEAFLEASMWARLALAIHTSRVHNDFDMCDVRAHKLGATEPIPWCLHGAVRFQHLGCDFHIDSSLTGYQSRLLECNKGPDLSVHSYKDGKMKRDVAADLLSLVGFKGQFDGSAAHARKHRMNLVYDSETFKPAQSMRFLQSLQFIDATKTVEANRKLVEQGFKR